LKRQKVKKFKVQEFKVQRFGVAKVTSFEDLDIWKLARQLAKDIYVLGNKGHLSKDFELRNHLNKTAGSIMDNIAEGFERGGNREFVQFLSIAKGSAAELRSQVWRALDREYISRSDFETLQEKSQTISKKISNLMAYLQSSSLRGSKYANEPLEQYGSQSSPTDHKEL
jgi:four helix bundle protein